MKPFVEKLHLDENSSFYVRTHSTPQFEVPWHQHKELELIFLKQGRGTAYIGNYVGEFEEGDVFFLGSNLPHTFQKANSNMFVSAVVIQFEADFLGNEFLKLPECKHIQEILFTSLKGMKFNGNSKIHLSDLIADLESSVGFDRIIKLAACLDYMSVNKEYKTVSTQDVKPLNLINKERVEKIYKYTIEYFKEPISLEYVAGIAALSVPAFCSYFKKCTKKTYIEFLNEVRIGNACKLLSDTQMQVNEICYESGFNTPANFNKQFLRIKKKTPMQYRRLFQNEMHTL